jgi:hypothetical protein
VILLILVAATRAAAGPDETLDRLAWKQQDIGAVVLKGSGTQEKDTLHISGAGAPGGEGLHYMFVSVPGDGELTARVESITSVDPSAQVGLMIRSVTTQGAAGMSLLIGRKGVPTVRFRSVGGRDAAMAPRVTLLQTPSGVHPYLRIRRSARRVEALYSLDGKSWDSLFAGDIDAPKGLLFGFAATTDGAAIHAGTFSGTFLGTAAFREVALRAPFHGHPVPIPGIIEAEDFDYGGQGVSYFDTDEVNHGPSHWPFGSDRPKETPYRDTAVDIAPTVEGDAYYVGWTNPGEWTEYSINVTTTDVYRFDVRVAFVACGGTFHVEVDGADVTGPLQVPNTNNWDADWQVVTKPGVSLAAGPHRLRLAMDTMGRAGAVGNFDSIRITPMSIPEPKPVRPAVVPVADHVAGHPRLLVSAPSLEQVRKSIQVPGSPAQHAYDLMKRRVVEKDWRAYLRASPDKDQYWNIARTTLARDAAFVYLLTGDATYAAISYEVLDDIYVQNDPEKVTLDYEKNEAGVLSRSQIAQGFALSFDWCFKAWSPAQREVVRSRIAAALETWPCVGHRSLQAPYHQGAVAIARTAELMLILALEEEGARADRYEWLKDMLRRHLSSYGPSGFHPHGLIEEEMSGLHIPVAAYALRGIGDASLTSDFGQHSWWRLLMYAHAFGDAGFLQVDNNPPGPLPRRGWASLLLGSVPGDQLPYYLWFYDRLVGEKAPARARADEDLWTVLYYPQDVSERAPDASFPLALKDDKHGAVYFRNAWNGNDDILISALADAWSTPRESENVAETFDLNVIAFGRRFAASHGAEKTEPYLFSTLAVDGQIYKHGVDTGGVDAFEPNARGGYVVLDGGSKYKNLGLAGAKRHVLVDFEPNGSDALLVTMDRLQAASPHVYTWQMKLGDGIRVTDAVEEGVPTFLLRADNGAFLKGWVITPGAVVVPDDPLQVSLKADKTDLWVVSLIGKGEPPKAHIQGAGLAATVEVGGRQLRFEPKTDRMSLRSSDKE